MNNTRRKEIKSIIERIEELQSEIADLGADIEAIHSDEEEYMDNIPENFQQSDRYYNAEAACDNLQSAIDGLEELDFDEIISSLEEAIE